MGKRELWQSLGTKDAREAKARVCAVLARWHAEFTNLRRRREATADELASVTWDHYQNEIQNHHDHRQRLPSADQIDAAKQAARTRIESGDVEEGPVGFINVVADAMLLDGQVGLDREFRARRRHELERHLAVNETVLVNDAVREVIHREGYAIEEESPAFRDLAHRLMRVEIEGLRRAEEQDRGDFTGKPLDPILNAHRASTAKVAAPGEGVMELFDAFARENPKGVKPDTLRMNREIVAWFAQHVGSTFPASAIDKRAVREWKQALGRFPIKAVEVREFRGLHFKKIVIENDRLKRPTLADRTINKYLSALGAFCQWLMQNGHLETNPVDGMHLGKDRRPSKIHPYTPDQLNKIFASPLFVGSQSEDEPHKPGNVHVRDHRYWLPLLALFTGARLGELAQLLASDVRQDRGRWIIHVTTEGDPSKVIKTKGSMRVIPVHPTLERLGFLSLHAECTGSRLFPEIKPDTRGSLAGHYSRWYARYLKRIGVKDDGSVNFHSFRHGMADALRRAGYRDEEFGFLLGHTQATTTGRYGLLAEGDLAQRCLMIEAVKFPGLDLAHLWLRC
nr:site-specific integrase [Methylobacterium sp. Leaf466]